MLAESRKASVLFFSAPFENIEEAKEWLQLMQVICDDFELN